MPVSRSFVVPFAAAVLALGAGASRATSPSPPEAQAPAPEPPAPDFALQDPSGRTVRLADFRGKVVVVTFGYTNCPDVCPMTLTILAEATRALGDDARRVQVVFITVDPERDSAERLGRYAPAFHPSFLGLRGDAAATARAAESFDVEYRKQPGRIPEAYSVDHTAASFIVDPDGQLRLIVAYGRDADGFVGDIRHLLAAFPAR